MDILGSTDLFNRSGLTFVLEAHVAAEIGLLRGASGACLIEDDRPDFELHFENRRELYELVEADREGRERGREYQALAEAERRVWDWPEEEWATAEQAFCSIRAAAEKKAKRAEALLAGGISYPDQTRLLFYVNLVDFGTNYDEIVRVFRSAVHPVRPWFSSIWLLWKSQLYEV
jgi:hypothetical protein